MECRQLPFPPFGHHYCSVAHLPFEAAPPALPTSIGCRIVGKPTAKGCPDQSGVDGLVLLFGYFLSAVWTLGPPTRSSALRAGVGIWLPPVCSVPAFLLADPCPRPSIAGLVAPTKTTDSISFYFQCLILSIFRLLFQFFPQFNCFSHLKFNFGLKGG
jgi:hypothetical protein